MAGRIFDRARARAWALRFAIFIVWLVLVEVGVRLIVVPKFVARFQCCTGAPTLCEVAQAYRGNAEFATFRAQPNVLFVHDPVLGYRLAANASPRMYKGGMFSTNALGARGPAAHGHARVPGRLRIVAVGDSYTMGQEVDDAETWAARVEGLDPRREVVNLGVSAYGVDQALLMLQREGMRYRPDVVVLGYFRDDLFRNLDRFACAAKPRFVVRGDDLMLENSPVPTPEALQQQVRRGSVAWRLVQYLLHEQHSQDQVDMGASQALGLRLVAEAARTARAGGARFVLLHLPDIFAFGHDGGWGDPFFREACRLPDVACVDALPALLEAVARSGTEARRAIFREHHYNPEGNRIVAGVLDAWLRAQRW